VGPSHREQLERLRDAYNQRDPDAWVEVWNRDAEWHPFLTAREEGDPGYHGENGMRAWFEDVSEMFEESQVDLEQIHEIGDRLLVLGRMRARRRGSADLVESEVGWVVEPKGEGFQRGWAYTSHEEAERAAKAGAPRGTAS
jgi:ketosteroid isomerase-like protein